MVLDFLNPYLGIVSIVIAIGMSAFIIIRDQKRRKNEELFFANEIKDDLRIIMQYFISISSKSENLQSHENEENEIVLNLDDFYTRNHQEMVDVLHVTKLYLPQWRTLDQDKKILVKQILDKFSWLLYEYYPLHMPDSIKKTRWQNKQQELIQTRTFVADNIPSILNEPT